MEKRIYGLETEYAVIISPEGISKFIPTRRDIFEALKDIISSHYAILDSKELKQGYFLQNGGRFHHEACLNNLLEGVIEFSTPECINPLEVSVYSRAHDEILDEVRAELEDKFQKKGFRGKIFFGKNSTDNKGNFYGTHENYLVEDEITGINRIILYMGTFFFTLIFVVAIIIINIPILASIISLFIIYILLALVQLLLSPIKAFTKYIRRLIEFIFEIIKILAGQTPSGFTRIFGEIFRYSTLWWAYSYGFFLRQFVLVKFTNYLTPFILTRVIFSGSGRFIINEPFMEKFPFSLSQKSESIKTVCTIFWDDYYKPIFSLKNFIKSPLALFNNKKRLHIMYSDSNMSDYVIYITTGITGLVIRMIEEGCPLDDLNPKDPIKALNEFSRDLSMKKKILLRNGKSMSSIEIQKYYLDKAKKFYSAAYPELPEDIGDLIKKWEYMLNCLEINPHFLYKELDWVAKKDLINEVVRKRKDILYSSDMLKWFKYFRNNFKETWIHMKEEELKEDLTGKMSWWKKRNFSKFLNKENISCSLFLEKFLIFNQIQKIDLKFHELNKDEGYHYKLSSAGLVIKMSEKEEVTKAKMDPPKNTRANIRGFLVKYFKSNSIKSQIGWEDALIATPESNSVRFIRFYDPFQKDLSEEDKNYINLLNDLKDKNQENQY